jgi:hypothetical protein
VSDETARPCLFQIISETDTEFLAHINFDGSCYKMDLRLVNLLRTKMFVFVFGNCKSAMKQPG